VSGFADVRADLAAKLAAAGLPATIDPAGNVPFVLVDLPSVVALTGGIGAWTSEVPVKIVAAPPGDATSTTWLCDQLELVLRTLGPALASPGQYTHGAGKLCPSYTVTYPADIPNPDC